MTIEDVTIEVVLGLGFGDEGKGTLVDWLARREVHDDARRLLVVRRVRCPTRALT